MTRSQVRQPNVIVVLTDQQRWDTTGAGGNPLGLTPTFDRMARSGTYAAEAFTPQPVCAPARAALQTGQYQTITGCYRNNIPLPEDSRTLAHHFAAAGYSTGYIGKWHLAEDEPPAPGQRGGYQSWLGANIPEFTSDAYRVVLFDDAGDPVFLPGYRSDALFDAAIRFVADRTEPPGACPAETGSAGEGSAGTDAGEIGSAERKPFFLFCSLIEPHHQNETDSYPAPEGYEERYQDGWIPPDLAALAGEPGATVHRHIGGYYGQIRRVDEGLARLLDALRSMEVLEDTIIAFTSDHGSHFKTRNREYKRSCHDASLRVPLAFRGPGFDGGHRIERPVSTIDLPPTLLDAAGIEVPAQMQGTSVLPLLTDQDSTDYPEEVFFQVSESAVGRGVRTGRWKYFITAPEADGWDDSASEGYVETALYDLAHDPYELDNLIGLPTHREVADQLRERLLRRMSAAGEDLPVIETLERTPRSARQRRVDPRVRDGVWQPTRFGHQSGGQP